MPIDTSIGRHKSFCQSKSIEPAAGVLSDSTSHEKPLPQTAPGDFLLGPTPDGEVSPPWPRKNRQNRCHWEGLGDVNKTPRLNMNLVGMMILECEVDSKQITKT